MSEPSADDQVGYGKPPRHSRFKKGQSGNPRGRPSLARVAYRILNEKIRVRENGERRTITKLEAMLKQLANKGVSGDLRAIREVLKLPVETGNGEDAGGWRPVVSGEPLSDTEWERRYGRSEADVAARREEALAVDGRGWM